MRLPDDVHRNEMSEQALGKVENILRPLQLTADHYRRVRDHLTASLAKGLHPDTHPTAAVKCLPSYVRAVPDGSERGVFIALDLGGTNFRVLLIKLDGKEVEMDSHIYVIPQHTMIGPGEKLFDHIADCIHRFLESHNLLGRELYLGFTFSFPCRQAGLDYALIIDWDKGFSCEDVVGQDVVKLLHDAMDRRGDLPNVRCLAVINDTVGTLVACAHGDNDCAVGLILGTGSNASYIEKLDEVKTWEGDQEHPREVLINCEWGAFGDDGCLEFLRTEFDNNVDKHSLNPKKQLFEKMIGGMYMGEIVRLVLVRLVMNGVLFDGDGSYHLSTRGRFYTKYVSEIEGDDVETFEMTKQILGELDIVKFTELDCRLIRHVCEVVSKRAAYLASAGVACLLNKMQRPKVTVGVDGSLYKFHPAFHNLMVEKVRELTDPHIDFKLLFSGDGSGKGAALVAAVAYRLLEQKAQNGRVNGMVF